jgi:nitrite reductase/ring-hydroxylating ferredoxin subunit
MYINVGPETRSIRSTPYDGRRLLIATGAPFTPGDATAKQQVQDLTRWLCDRFAVEEVAYTWAAQDNHTGDQVSFIGRLHPRAAHAWVATGFGGWGMTNGVLAGLLIRDLVRGQLPDWGRIYDTRRAHPRLEAGTVASIGAKTVSRWAGSRLRAALDPVDSVEKLGPGEAGLVSDEEGRWATYVDDSGTVHSVSSTCTHMGCLVSFNDVERDWECPCHGSRFALDGSVLQGPATAPLRRRPGRP